MLDVSPFGARFTLIRPTAPGRLIRLKIPMPRQLRSFDFEKELYEIWAVVCHVAPMPRKDGGALRYEVGVAFIGQTCPASYGEYPLEVERDENCLRGMIGKRESLIEKRKGLVPGVHSEHPTGLDVGAFDHEGQVYGNERVVTENLSWRGAAVITQLDLECGRFIRISDCESSLSAVAAVRARREGGAGWSRLHVEFVDRVLLQEALLRL